MLSWPIHQHFEHGLSDRSDSILVKFTLNSPSGRSPLQVDLQLRAGVLN